MTLKVLFVDDEPAILKSVERVLRDNDEGWELHFTEDAVAAVDVVGEHRIDIVVSDHKMPAMTGIELCAQLRALYPQVARILMTAHADQETTVAAINEGHVDYFLAKPWKAERLREILRLAARDVLSRRPQPGSDAKPNAAAATRSFAIKKH